MNDEISLRRGLWWMGSVIAVVVIVVVVLEIKISHKPQALPSPSGPGTAAAYVLPPPPPSERRCTARNGYWVDGSCVLVPPAPSPSS